MPNVDDAQWSPPLIQTKLTPPRRPRRLVSRRALVDRLGTDLERKLTLVVAPAGFGKSTLLAEWRDALIEKDYAVAWLSLDRDDDDLNQFIAYLLAAISRASSGIGRRAQDLLKNDPLASTSAVLSALINEIAASDRSLVLILDDFDCLASTAIHEAMFRLLRYAPDNFHGVIAGWAEPSMPLSFFRTTDQLVRLDADDLRFGLEEAQAFFAQVAGLKLDRNEIGMLWDATDGWVAGLQLASLALTEQGNAAHLAELLPKATRDIDAYLTEAVLSHVPPGVVDFLLRTSILERLSPALCNAITGSTDAKEMLDWLESRNMFLKPFNKSRDWYCYHTLFSEYLRRRLLRQRANEIVLLHRRASEWFAAQSLWPEAVKHALAAGDVQQAAIWVESNAMMFVERSDVRTVLSLVAKLPVEATRTRFRLRLAHAWALALSLQLAEATKALDEIKADMDAIRCELLAVSAAIAGLSDDGPSAVQLGQSALAMGPLPGTWVERTAQTAVLFGLGTLSRFDEVQRMRDAEQAPTVSAEPIYAEVYRQSVFGYCALLEGRLPEATRWLEAALERAEAAVGCCSAAAVVPAGHLSELMYERNDLARAAEILRDRFAIALEACPLGSLMCLCLTSARLCAVKLSFAEAHRVLKQAQSVGRKRKWLRLQVACMGEAIRLYLLENRLADAEATAKALTALMPPNPPAHGNVSPETWQLYRSAQCRLLIGRAQGAEAVPELQSLLEEQRSGRRLYQAARTAVLLAVALEQTGSRDEALVALTQAVLFGQENGLIRTFLDEGEDVGRLLSQLALHSDQIPGVDACYIDDLLVAFQRGSAPANAAAETLAAGKLSAREIEILDYIARGLTNKEIARALRVAPETVKWHLKHIYEKLNVSSRLQAVQKRGAPGQNPHGV